MNYELQLFSLITIKTSLSGFSGYKMTLQMQMVNCQNQTLPQKSSNTATNYEDQDKANQCLKASVKDLCNHIFS